MNYKLEKFWKLAPDLYIHSPNKWTINLKSFEKILKGHKVHLISLWTINLKSFEILLETWQPLLLLLWTINLKSFEISFKCFFYTTYCMNYKLEKFWKMIGIVVLLHLGCNEL